MVSSYWAVNGRIDRGIRVAHYLLLIVVSQRHGERLTRGWAPLLRLLEIVPRWEDAATTAAAFQNVELLCSDFLATLPKEYLQKACTMQH